MANIYVSSQSVPYVRRDGRIATSGTTTSTNTLASSSGSSSVGVNLVAIEALAGTVGILTKVSAGVWGLDTGTPGYVPYYDATGGLFSDSPIFANATAAFVGYIADPTSGNKFAVNGATYIGGALTVTGTVTGVTATMVGLGSVDNTADTAKPVSTAQQTALNLKANIASPTFTGTVGGITKSMVGLGSVDNTADSAKPVSTAQQTALNLKANIASPTFTGTVTAPTFVTSSAAIQFSGTTKWTVTADTAGLLLFKNASGTLEMTLSQTGAINAKGEVTAFATI